MSIRYPEREKPKVLKVPQLRTGVVSGGVRSSCM